MYLQRQPNHNYRLFRYIPKFLNHKNYYWREATDVPPKHITKFTHQHVKLELLKSSQKFLIIPKHVCGHQF